MISDVQIMPPTTPLPRGVRQALEAMRAQLARDWNLKELSQIAGLSGRTLQRQFQAFLGKAPGLVLRDLRFDFARRELLQASPGTKVMDVALHCGVAHLGRFSAEYRRRYGETPTQTLKRQEVLAGTLAAMPSVFVASPDRPSIALSRFDAGPDHGEFVRCIADELASAFTRSGFGVTQSASARYLLTGAVRGSGRQSRLTLRLIETKTGRHLSAHRTDGVVDDECGPDERLATSIVAALQPCLRIAEIDRALRQPDFELGAQDLALRAMPGVLSLDQDGNTQALDLLERAMAREPGHALALALAAWANIQRVIYHFSTDPAADRARSIELARKARAQATDATVLAILGNALTLLDDLDSADLVIRKALAIDGGSAWGWSRSGWIDVYRGEPASAIERFKIALDLAPDDCLAFNSLIGIGCAQFRAGNYLDAVRWQERALIAHPTATWVHRTLCPSYLLGGARLEASRSLTALRQQYPELTLAEVQQGMPPLPQLHRDLIVDCLHSVGLPG
jgi:AraC-like DNA-binding protein/tetratricopeptide (TPR) repeat protein